MGKEATGIGKLGVWGVQYVYQREPVKREPPPKRAMALLYVRTEIAAGRDFPTTRAIAAHMGWKNEESARHVLDALTGDGQLRRIRTKRGLKWELLP